MMSGDFITAPPLSEATSRKLGNGRQSPTSPLKLFGLAKKKINDIFIDINGYITETNKFLSDIAAEDGIVSAEQVEQAMSYAGKVNGIREMLCRDRMKVAFHGRTSNGKSSVINAMLRCKILPTGIGHTTNCFLQVEGTDGSDPFILTEDGAAPMSVQSIGGLAHALSSVRLTPDSLIRICWPKDKCSLLKDDVVFVDSPGIDVSPDLDSWIDDHCLDADVFVLVANAESTLMQTEKNFFHKVSSKLSKPNIFILNNRWDASASEPELQEEVRLQHLERSIAFLSDELKVVDKHCAEDRVFFVSARETLISRLHQEQGTPTPSGQLFEGFQGRIFEFCNFERKFEECISQSAVQTKFEQHTANGKLITSDLRLIMENVSDKATTIKKQSEQVNCELQDKLDFTGKQLNLLSSEIKDKIRQMTEEVERKVSRALMEEIRRLSTLVDEFDRPFHPDQLILNVYKKELHAHVEAGLGRNLQTRCSAALKTAVEGRQQEMTERLTALLPEESRQQMATLLPSRDFEVAYRLDCRNLCADFREDIQFRFSLGITSLMRRFLGPKGVRSVLTGYTDNIARPLATTPQTPSNGQFPVAAANDNEALMAMLSTFTSLYSRSTIGVLAISGLIGKAAGWRVIAVCAAAYGLLYVYERLMWTNKARERAFKRQYVNYASSKLRLIVDLTGSNCSHQVQQELSTTFAQLGRQVDVAKSELQDEIKTLEVEITKLDEIATRANFLKNKAAYMDSELNSFVQQYLNPDSKL